MDDVNTLVYFKYSNISIDDALALTSGLEQIANTEFNMEYPLLREIYIGGKKGKFFGYDVCDTYHCEEDEWSSGQKCDTIDIKTYISFICNVLEIEHALKLNFHLQQISKIETSLKYASSQIYVFCQNNKLKEYVRQFLDENQMYVDEIILNPDEI